MNSNIGTLVRIGITIVLLLLGLSFLGQTGMMGSWGYARFGSMGMILMWLIPVELIVLTFLGIVRFIQGRSSRLSDADRVSPIAERVCKRHNFDIDYSTSLET